MTEQFEIKSRQAKMILLATILASGMAFLLTSAVGVALPAIQSGFDANINQIQWVVNAFTLSLAVLILISGSLGDNYGRKKIFILGMLIFITSASLSGLAISAKMLIFCQAIQGIGAAMMIPQSLAIINSCLMEKNRGQAIGLWAGLSGAIAALGPFLGGGLVELFSWRSVFFINIPLGLLAVTVAILYIPETGKPKVSKLDLTGTMFIALGLFGLSYGFITGPQIGWNNQTIIICLIGGTTAIIAFIINESLVYKPLVPLNIFSNPLVTGANIVTFTLYFALNGTIFFLILNLQQIQGYSPISAGLGLLPPIIIISVLSGPAGSMADRIGPRLQMITGPFIVFLGILFLIIPGIKSDYFIYFMPGLILFGIGMAIVIAPLTKSALSVRTEYSGAASGINNGISRIAALMAVALLTAIAFSVFNNQLEINLLKTRLTASERIQILDQAEKFGGIVIPESFNQTSRKIAEKAVHESFVTGFRLVMGINAFLAFVSILVSWITIRNPVHKNLFQTGQ